MDELGAVVGLLLVLVLLWLVIEIRQLHAELQPLIDAPIVQTLSRIGTT